MLDLEKYATQEGKTPLNAEFFNSRFYAIVRRIHALELLRMDWEAAVSQIQNAGIERLNNAIAPLVDGLAVELTALVETGNASLDGWGDAFDAKIAEVDAAIASAESIAADILAANNRTVITATPGQTVFNLPFSYHAAGNGLAVYINGLKQYGGAYFYGEQDGDGRATSVTMSAAMAGGEKIEFVGFETDGVSSVNYTDIYSEVSRKAKIAAIIFS